MKKLFKEALEDSPIIAAVKDDEGLSRCLTSDSQIGRASCRERV